MPQAASVTIGITCFNAEDTIIPALEGALRQDYPAFDILVVDDGSTDSSVLKIEEFIKGRTSIRLIRHAENRGFPSALNTLVAEATGEYIAFFDDDDVSTPDRLQKQVERITSYAAQAGTDKILCYTNRVIVHAGDKEPIGRVFAIGRTAPEPHGQMVADYVLWSGGEDGYVWGMFGSCTLMVRRTVLRDVSGFDPDFRRCAEWDMAVRAAQAGAHFIAVDEPLVCQTKTVTSDKGGKIPLVYALKLRTKYKKVLQDKNIYLASRMVARARYWGGRDSLLMSRAWYIVACLLSPDKLLWRQVQKRLGRHAS